MSIRFTEPQICAAADEKSWQRGVDYAEQGRVSQLTLDGDVLRALVAGQTSYAVTLAVEGARLVGECDCPMGMTGVFCKHCVAAGLAFLRCDAAVPTLDDVCSFLAKQPAERLAGWLMEHAQTDPRLRERLLLRAARDGAEPDRMRLAGLMDEAFNPPMHLTWDGVGPVLAAMDEAVAALADLLDDGHAKLALELIEQALEDFEANADEVPDEHGEILLIGDRLAELHLLACARVNPKPKKLAERLFHDALGGGHDVLDRYADVLGEKGRAHFHKLTLDAWAELPTLVPGDAPPGFDLRRRRLKELMEQLAGDDLDARIAIEKKDLSHPQAFLRLARLLAKSGRDEEATAWAEQGLQAFDTPGHGTAGLENFLIDAHRAAGQHDAAAALRWAQFQHSRTYAIYAIAKDEAADDAAWQAWRRKALRLLRAKGDDSSWQRRGETLVRVLLAEGDVAGAWRTAHQRGRRLPSELWHDLAAARGRTHPVDALTIYRRGAEAAVAQANKPGYAAAVALVRRMTKLLDAQNKPNLRQDQQGWLGNLRDTHRRKRSFLAMLDDQSNPVK
jgi:uncharacterized Zn finger protein